MAKGESRREILWAKGIAMAKRKLAKDTQTEWTVEGRGSGSGNGPLGPADRCVKWSEVQGKWQLKWQN